MVEAKDSLLAAILEMSDRQEEAANAAAEAEGLQATVSQVQKARDKAQSAVEFAQQELGASRWYCCTHAGYDM